MRLGLTLDFVGLGFLAHRFVRIWSLGLGFCYVICSVRTRKIWVSLISPVSLPRLSVSCQ